MKYTEELLWILDDPNATIHNQDEKFQKNIAFVHSLGLKCDGVGWSKLNLADPRANEILEHIAAFCNENGWTARGWYTRRYAEQDSEWFELIPTSFQDSTYVDRIETVTENQEKIYTHIIRAFHEVNTNLKSWGNDLFVSERFRDACIRLNCDDLDFCWTKDIGKYEAAQYFHVYGKQLIPQVAIDCDLKNSTERIRAAGGWLPRITEVIHTLQTIALPNCYLANDLPKKGIAYAYIPRPNHFTDQHAILIHRDTAQILLREKVISANALRPAPVVDELPGGYVLQQTQHIRRPSANYMNKMLLEYEKLKATPRPVRQIAEKEALKTLRNSKKERKEDFQKAMPKAKGLDLQKTNYAPVIPYYLVANGCFLSDEYEFLSYNQAVEENDEFYKNLEKEELLVDKPAGIVIAKCPDGDHILLCNDGFVIRFSHEAPEITEQWQSLAQFIVNSVSN